MSDPFPPEKRSAIMQAIRGRDTAPERIVRSLLHRLGYRFRLHVRALPGCPDIVFPRRRCIIFVHGCFWHRHCCRKGRSVPATRANFWRRKFRRNMECDARQIRRLRRLGWSVMTVWECQVSRQATPALFARIRRFLGPPGPTGAHR